MKKVNVFFSALLSAALILNSCNAVKNANSTTKGAALGAGGGAGVGALIGSLIHGKHGAAWGAGVGALVGGGAGALIGHKMDKQKKELEAINGAKVESTHEGQALKVTFESGILFDTNSSTLNIPSRTALTQFAQSLKSNSDTDIRIYGHTDSTGSDKINLPLSDKRAGAVEQFLESQGVSTHRMTYQGFGSSQPVADNGSSLGRQQNRRVEVFILPNEKMVQEAKAGTLK
jgi:outer membrane protein OmpA-like peptidoglycan-associated protein